MRKIGIVGASVGENSFGAGKTYMEWIAKELKGFPIILGSSLEIDPTLDLVIMPGGMDASPDSYGEAPGYFTSNTDVMKQHFATYNLPLYIEAGVPIFGICLGFQMLGVHFGCKLVQNISGHNEDERGKRAHDITFTTKARELMGLDVQKMGVNSHHHQAILYSGMSDEIIPLARAQNKEEDADSKIKNHVLEAFIHKHFPVAAVQHHPEEWYDPFTTMLVDSIIERAAEQKENGHMNSVIISG